MTAAVQRRRHSSSGPFLNNAGSNSPPVPIGEGSPGLVWRFQGDEDPQAFTDGAPNQLMKFSGGIQTVPFLPLFQTPGWIDFELWLPFAQWGTATVEVDLLMKHQFVGHFSVRHFNVINAGNTEAQGILVSDRMLWFANDDPFLLYQSFQIDLTVEDDTASDNILDSPNAYAKFTQYVAPPSD